MKSHGVAIQMNPRYQNFHIVLFIYNVVQNFWVWGWNTMVLPFRWNLLGRTFEWCHLSISYTFGIFAKIYWSAFLWLRVKDLLSTLIPLISLFFLILLEACAWSFYLTRMSWQKPTSLLPSREIKVMSHVGYLVRVVSVTKILFTSSGCDRVN